jgi:hypothetical protein
VSYPALLAVGLPPVTANVTNTVALVLTSVGSVSASRPELAGQGRRLLPMVAAGVLGGAAGAGLLLHHPAEAFERLVPVLIGGAALAILLQRPPRELAAEGRRTRRGRDPWWLVAGTRWWPSTAATSAPRPGCCCWRCCCWAPARACRAATPSRTWCWARPTRWPPSVRAARARGLERRAAAGARLPGRRPAGAPGGAARRPEAAARLIALAGLALAVVLAVDAYG